jgi:hypothetical protein
MEARNLQGAGYDYLCDVFIAMVSYSTGQEQISQSDPWNYYYVRTHKSSHSQTIMKEGTSETKLPKTPRRLLAEACIVRSKCDHYKDL